MKILRQVLTKCIPVFKDQNDSDYLFQHVSQFGHADESVDRTKAAAMIKSTTQVVYANNSILQNNGTLFSSDKM